MPKFFTLNRAPPEEGISMIKGVHTMFYSSSTVW